MDWGMCLPLGRVAAQYRKQPVIALPRYSRANENGGESNFVYGFRTNTTAT